MCAPCILQEKFHEGLVGNIPIGGVLAHTSRILSLFGYSHKRTVLQCVTLWFRIILAFGYHYYKWNQSEKIKAERAAAKNLDKDVEGAPESFVEDSIILQMHTY